VRGEGLDVPLRVTFSAAGAGAAAAFLGAMDDDLLPRSDCVSMENAGRTGGKGHTDDRRRRGWMELYMDISGVVGKLAGKGDSRVAKVV
jgi:hypothetical protein